MGTPLALDEHAFHSLNPGGFAADEPAVTSFLVAVLILAALVAVSVHVYRWYGERRLLNHGLPPLVIPVILSGGEHAESTTPILTAPPPSAANAGARYESYAPPPQSAVMPPPLAASPVLDAPVRDAASALNETVQFRRPADEAIQLLPGRLDVLAGVLQPREIRFVRIPGEQPHLILGREAGATPQHVVLHSNTVSRQHARLDYVDGNWVVTNLSRTNPVVVNDEPVPAEGARSLVDGDRIELGEVILRFAAH